MTTQPTTVATAKVREAFERLLALAEQRNLDAVFHVALLVEMEALTGEAPK